MGDLDTRVAAAVAAVDDPEMPGVSIVDLGLLEQLWVDADTGGVRVGLIPTFTGCPALDMIREEVAAAVTSVEGVASVEVEFLASPAWSVDRITPAGRKRLADVLGVAVQLSAAVRCPRCDAPTRQESLFGPTRCRSVHRCTGCGEVVEVMR
jgi:ring-1,2-phenylacetyl-CoA epoxidase subunit PaaD